MSLQFKQLHGKSIGNCDELSHIHNRPLGFYTGFFLEMHAKGAYRIFFLEMHVDACKGHMHTSVHLLRFVEFNEILDIFRDKNHRIQP